jgi:hypothetical protein
LSLLNNGEGFREKGARDRPSGIYATFLSIEEGAGFPQFYGETADPRLFLVKRIEPEFAMVLE